MDGFFPTILLLVGLLGTGTILALLVVTFLPHSVYFPRWVSLWLVFSNIIVSYDAGFILCRPESFNMTLWFPYQTYMKIDKSYADLQDVYVYAQSIMNVVEIFVNVIAILYLTRRHFKTAAIIAIIASTMTASKTVLYFLMEIVDNFKYTRQDDVVTFIFFYIFPNGIWIVVPALVIYHLGAVLVRDKPAQD